MAMWQATVLGHSCCMPQVYSSVSTREATSTQCPTADGRPSDPKLRLVKHTQLRKGVHTRVLRERDAVGGEHGGP